MESDFLFMRHINKRYAGVQALTDIDFSIRQGEIHCLAGTNGSGKSTLIKIICGVEQPDPNPETLIRIAGDDCHRLSRMDAIRYGIQVIYQDLSLFPNLSVQENISMSDMMSDSSRFVSWKKHREIALKAMEKIGISIPLDKKVAKLSMADQQLVAISRALTKDVKLLIMDEPTTALTKKEVDALLRVIRDLNGAGVATLFISHKLNELIQVADRVTVLRDGKKVGCFSCSELDAQNLERYMTGTNTSYVPYRFTGRKEGTPILECKKLCRKDNFKDIDLTVYPGEIIGLTGLLGSGRTELALSLFGLNPPSSGECRLCGERVDLRSVTEAMRQGVAYVPENRLVEGLVLEQSIEKNIVMTVLERNLTYLGLLDGLSIHKQVDRYVEELRIKIPGTSFAARTLSGGNQQRVVLAKWIATNPKLFILDNPTVGIDVAAKSGIHEIIKKLASEGMGVIIISDEIAEVLYNSNRVLVMNRGRIIGEFDSENATESDIQAFIDSHAVREVDA
ncbi:sugar ABC transporter ATP-binding protein [Treponema parvum]|uniref:Sugar ABC transporter ATP-binding protein n=1 Tax=Treponema parvum TaxID=138851 RepID=A0A975F5A8_9SPIR|nr:sugar ABC transporter ATP-binding protein [Treponema parvum]QTQ14244.1 sugar ABC transporter ATP-binding protein [Treponema parvum]